MTEYSNFGNVIHVYSHKHLFLFLFGIILIFLLGLYDDKFEISANYKLLASSLIVLTVVTFDPGMQVKKLNFSSINYVVFFHESSVIFTTLCILILLHAFNMFDGINLQSGFLYFAIYTFFVTQNIMFELSITIIIGLIFFLFLNLRNKIFLGDNGSYLLSFLTSYILIKEYNYERNLFADEIVLYLLFPGLDLLRLFIERLFKNKHPFKPDTNHIHHLLTNRFGYKIAIILIIISITTPFILQNFIKFDIIFSYVVVLLTYFLLLFLGYGSSKKNIVY